MSLVASDRKRGFFDIKCSLGKLHELQTKFTEFELVADLESREQTGIPAVAMASPPPPTLRAVNTSGQEGAAFGVEEETPAVDSGGMELEMSMDTHAAQDPTFDQVESDSMDDQVQSDSMDADALEDEALHETESDESHSSAAEELAVNETALVESDSSDSEEPNNDVYIVRIQQPLQFREPMHSQFLFQTHDLIEFCHSPREMARFQEGTTAVCDQQR